MSLPTIETNAAETPNSEGVLLTNIQHARELRETLHTAWWKASREKHKSAELAAAERAAYAALNAVTAAAKKQFGNNRAHPDCDYCLEVSVFGGPDHVGSRNCKSGKRPHCTCDLCF